MQMRSENEKNPAVEVVKMDRLRTFHINEWHKHG